MPSKKKRINNKNLQERRSRSWTRGEMRKARRKKEREESERLNRAFREAGVPTPWELAKQERRERRKHKQRELSFSSAGQMT